MSQLYKPPYAYDDDVSFFVSASHCKYMGIEH